MTMFKRADPDVVATFTPTEAQVLRQCVAELFSTSEEPAHV